MDFDKVISERKSVRKFHSKKPNWRDIIEAVDAGVRAPLAGAISSVRFILVDNPEIISKLATAAQQDFVGEAHYVVVVCSDPTDVIRSYDERGEIYVRQQAGAAIENFILKLTDLGLATCWVGDFVDEQVKSALRIPASVFVEAMFPIGYSLDKSVKKRAPNLDKTLYFNRYKLRFLKPRKEIDSFSEH
ncbi:MAG: nitroreductase family protein [Candidatus Pacearchaeota archaeon]|jgi:nitroreductase